MKENLEKNVIAEAREDADDFIKAYSKVPKERKPEVLMLIRGFALGAAEKKAV